MKEPHPTTSTQSTIQGGIDASSSTTGSSTSSTSTTGSSTSTSTSSTSSTTGSTTGSSTSTSSSTSSSTSTTGSSTTGSSTTGSSTTGSSITSSSTTEVSATVDTTGVTVWLNGTEVYWWHNQTKKWAGEERRFHAGVHVLVLHQHRYTILQHDLFRTWQPAAHRMLVRMVQDVQDGRVMLFLGAPDFVAWIQDDMVDSLLELGSCLAPLAARGEAWAFLTRKGHAPLHETLITSRNASSTDVSPLAFSATLPFFPERACPWYQEPELATKAEFCETYEGYHDFCHCLHPIHLHPSTSPHLRLEQVIPVALVTARRLPMVARQVAQLWSSPGGGQTPLAILVDGYSPQAEMLASILNLTVRFHDNPMPRGTKHRVNQHIRFSLETIFELYPEVDKAILLEDDLSLAPDFIDYFQQTSILMSLDPTVMCVNAYNYNAFPHTAHDPARIYRVQSYPYYGWMTSRTHARRMLANWAPLELNADWDLYVRHYHVDEQHEVVIPEVPRTRHEGGSGVHVTGLEQEVSYDRRPLNDLVNVTLNLRRHWQLAYSLDMMAVIKLGTVVTVSKHPCVEVPVPKYQTNTTHVIYIHLTGDEDKENAYKVLGKCMGFYHQNPLEHFRGTFSFKFFETPVILVSCFSSAYCDKVPPQAIYRPSEEDVTYAKKHPWRQSNSTSQVIWRVPPTSILEEFLLQNIVGIEVIINE